MDRGQHLRFALYDQHRHPMTGLFDRFSTGCARFTGRPVMFVFCILVACTGVAAFVSGSDRALWATSIAISSVTLLLLPILQATQNRDGAALQAKLDELIRTNSEARDALIGLENRSEVEIQEMRNEEQNSASHGITGLPMSD